MKIKPYGYFVLVKVDEVEQKSAGGIVLPEDYVEKEQAVIEKGVVIAFGPTAYVGMRGCEREDMERTGKAAHQLWGVEVGDTVEFKKYEGKKSALTDCGSYRYIPDTHLMGGPDNG
jgi:co-chaperonin GroES (HSP10)